MWFRKTVGGLIQPPAPLSTSVPPGSAPVIQSVPPRASPIPPVLAGSGVAGSNHLVKFWAVTIPPIRAKSLSRAALRLWDKGGEAPYLGPENFFSFVVCRTPDFTGHKEEPRRPS